MSIQDGHEMDDIRRRLDDHGRKFDHLERQQDDQFGKLSALAVDVSGMKTDISYMRGAVNTAANNVNNLTATINRWKGGAVVIIALASLLGPVLAIVVRWLWFGAPLSK